MPSAAVYITLPAVLQRTPSSSAAPRSSAEFRHMPSAAHGFDRALQKEAAQTANAIGQPQRSHTVQQGDKLWAICRDCLRQQGKSSTGPAIHEAVQAVAQANNIKNPDLLRLGQKLDLSVLNRPQPAASQSGVTGKQAGAAPHMLASSAEAAALHARPQQAPGPPAPSTTAGGAPAVGGSARERAARILEQLRSQIQAAKRTEETRPPVKADERLLHRTDMARLMENLLEESGVPKQRRISVTPWSGLLDASNARLSSGFGMRKDPFTGRPQHHNGIDVAAPRGTKIYPYASGTVVEAGWNGGYGRMVTIRHANGTETRYGHTSKNLVKAGDQVTLGEPIAEVGSTGRSTGPHLHFEMRRNGQPVDPVPYLSGRRLNLAQR